MPPPSPRPPFPRKLHETLVAAEFPDQFRFVSNDTFEITMDEEQAIAALAPSFIFKSLSSFIRQLSYYGFKRLSDRRRSLERRAGTSTSYIVFGHPSGWFLRDDDSQIERIVRKVRARKAGPPSSKRGRKASTASVEPEASTSPDPDAARRLSPPRSPEHMSPWGPPAMLEPVGGPLRNNLHLEFHRDDASSSTTSQALPSPHSYPSLSPPLHPHYSTQGPPHSYFASAAYPPISSSHFQNDDSYRAVPPLSPTRTYSSLMPSLNKSDADPRDGRLQNMHQIHQLHQQQPYGQSSVLDHHQQHQQQQNYYPMANRGPTYGYPPRDVMDGGNNGGGGRSMDAGRPLPPSTQPQEQAYYSVSPGGSYYPPPATMGRNNYAVAR